MASVDAERIKPIGPDGLIHCLEEDGRSLAGRIEKESMAGPGPGPWAWRRRRPATSDVGTESGVCYTIFPHADREDCISNPMQDLQIDLYEYIYKGNARKFADR